jgi:hypothetical protein
MALHLAKHNQGVQLGLNGARVPGFSALAAFSPFSALGAQASAVMLMLSQSWRWADR